MFTEQFTLGTDTIKRGASPSSVKHVKIQESSSTYSIAQKKLTKDLPIDDASFPLTSAETVAPAAPTRRGVEFYEPHKPHTKSDEITSYSKYGELGAKTRTSYGDTSTYGTAGKTALSSLSTEDYKAMRNKSSATSSSSSSQATVLSAAGSTATSAPTTSSDDSDDLISYKSSASTNALLAQSQAMTTSQLMSKYLKREPRVQFTPIKSPDSPSPPGSDGLPKGVYHLTTSKSKTAVSTGAISKHSAPSSSDPNGSSNHKGSSPSRQVSGKEASSATSLVSTGRRLFDSLASSEAEARPQAGGSSSTTTTVATSATYNDSKSVASSHISNKQQSSEHRSYGSSLFGSSAQGGTSPFATVNGNGSSASNGTHNAMHLYGTLPKNGPSANATGNGSSGGAGGMYGSTTSASYYSTSSSSGAHTASSSGVSSMTGSTTSYDYYTTSSASYTSAASTRSYGNGGGNGGGGNYHTLGTYRVQYAATNPFLEAFDAPGNGGSGGNGGNGAGNGNRGSSNNGGNGQQQGNASSGSSSHNRTSLLAALHGSDSKNGSDEFDDLK